MKKKIDAAEIMKDIKRGLGDVPIMEKYELAPTEYMSILEKLRSLKGLEGQEVARRLLKGDWSTVGFDARRTRRCYLILSVLARDLTDTEIRGQVQDLTERGFQLAGVAARAGVTREFILQSETTDGYLMPFVLKAQCRWSGTDSVTGSPVSGFEIIQISMHDMEELQKLIDLMTICDRQ
ncbi:MAG: hypothetical protein HY912_05560 [Desulfomonile tiedjei]|uniref:Uncharacterized protein n=1 Tax=Desulfomonile tiedjei TaxID=2358 RepID=A0A9D6V1E1_9BACT|nr:hypothetical protein [Desulfomonile tiedjei]